MPKTDSSILFHRWLWRRMATIHYLVFVILALSISFTGYMMASIGVFILTLVIIYLMVKYFPEEEIDKRLAAFDLELTKEIENLTPLKLYKHVRATLLIITLIVVVRISGGEDVFAKTIQLYIYYIIVINILTLPLYAYMFNKAVVRRVEDKKFAIRLRHEKLKNDQLNNNPIVRLTDDGELITENIEYEEEKNQQISQR